MARFIRGTALAFGTAAMLATPAYAEDAAKTGILAGIGVAAATGKTSLGEGAGAIEAGLMSTDAFAQAASLIAGAVIRGNVSRRSVIILTGDEQVDLISPRQLAQQIEGITEYLKAECQNASIQAEQAAKKSSGAPVGFDRGLGKIKVPDVTGVYMTDVTIGGIKLSATDRRLVNALLIAGRRTASGSPEMRDRGASQTSDATTRPDFRVIGEPVSLLAKDGVSGAFTSFTATLKDQRTKCPLERGAKAIALAEELRKSLLDTSKGPSPLATAIQLEVAGDNPMVLRIAIEQIGGTSIARSGVVYSLGWPNATTVSAGLLVSYRLIDPSAPGTMTVGEIRCMTPQINIKSVHDRLKRKTGKAAATLWDTACDSYASDA